MSGEFIERETYVEVRNVLSNEKYMRFLTCKRGECYYIETQPRLLPPQQQQASATASMRNVPRFGKSNDFSQLFESQDEATDYIVGLLFAGIMIFTIYFTWTIVLLVFKCLGQKRVGFLSGSPFVKKSSSSCCLSIYRVVYLLCAICLIIFSILFVTEGLMNLKTSIVTVIESARVSNFDVVASDIHLYMPFTRNMRCFYTNIVF